VVII
jgi:hypothetical protein